jgi:hypothetical protein
MIPVAGRIMQSRLFAIAIAFAIMFAIAGAPAPLPAQTRDEVTPAPLAKKSPAVKKRPARQGDGRQIACTFLGCQPIPRNCRPTAGYNWWTGEPTGFDVVVCR